jgi:hypothetical protein
MRRKKNGRDRVNIGWLVVLLSESPKILRGWQVFATEQKSGEEPLRRLAFALSGVCKLAIGSEMRFVLLIFATLVMEFLIDNPKEVIALSIYPSLRL